MYRNNISSNQKKRLLFNRFNRQIKSISVIGIVVSLSVAVNSSIAATVDTPQTRAVSQIANSTINKATNPIQDFVNDVNSFIQGTLFGGITGLVNNALGSVEVPDLGEVVGQIMKGSLPEDGQTTTKLENNLENSYAIRLDLANQSERVGAIQVAQTKTLSKNAQTKAKQKLEEGASLEFESSQMADDSQNSDTSQQILQNISQQLKDSTTIASLQFQEAVQARFDNALNLNLGAQAAQELNAVNTRERQSAITAGNAAIVQGGLFVMPGSAILDKSSSN